jgi:L-cystine transport system permease protein
LDAKPVKFLLYIARIIPRILEYLPKTLLLVVASLFFGTILGLLLVLAKLSVKHKNIRALAYGYSTLIRSIPSIVLLFLVFYGVPAIVSLFGINIAGIPAEIFVVITFTFFSGSFLSEVFRSAYEAIDKGQFEAAVSIGLKGSQALWRIVLPQALYVAIPNIGNTIISLVKEAALAYTVGVIDIMGRAQTLNSLTYGTHTLEYYIAVSIIYWLLSIGLERGRMILEKSLGKPYRRGPGYGV